MLARLKSVRNGYAHASLVDGGEVVFLDARECEFALGHCLEGDVVNIDAVEESLLGGRHRVARRVVWVERPLLGEPVEGQVVRLHKDRAFGFLRSDWPHEQLLFHVSGFEDYKRGRGKGGESATFNVLSIGDRLKGSRQDTERGPRAVQLVRVTE